MKAKQAIEILQTLDPSTEVGPWMKCHGSHIIDTLQFLDAGKAIRIIVQHLGKPYSAVNMDQSGHPLPSRNIIWSTDNKHQQVIAVCNELEKAGITAFKVTPTGWFHIHIQRDLYFSSFIASDDPADWQRRQDRRAEMAEQRQLINQEKRKIQLEQQNKSWIAYLEKSKKEQEQAKLAAEKLAREAKEAAEKRVKEAAEHRQRVIEAQNDPSRSIEVKGGD